MIIFGLGGGEVVVYYIAHSTLKFGKNTIIGEDTMIYLTGSIPSGIGDQA